jgi:hypothetical protein
MQLKSVATTTGRAPPAAVIRSSSPSSGPGHLIDHLQRQPGLGSRVQKRDLQRWFPDHLRATQKGFPFAAMHPGHAPIGGI